MRGVHISLCCLGWLLLASGAGATTIIFEEGGSLPSGGSYSGTEDTMVREFVPDTTYGADTTLSIDQSRGCPSCPDQSLILFGGIFGGGPDQIPVGSIIVSAVLSLDIVDPSAGAATLSAYRMLASWDESSTWNSLVNGVSTDDVEAVSSADATSPGDPIPMTLDVTASLQAWVNDPASNLGWVLLINSNNGLTFTSSEGAVAPSLTVNFVPEPGTAVLTGMGLALLAFHRRRT
jgi:hypothetical protein